MPRGLSSAWSLCLSWYYRHYALVKLSFVEINCTINKCIEGVVLTLRNTCAWEMLVATLTHNNVASYNLLTTENLNTKSL